MLQRTDPVVLSRYVTDIANRLESLGINLEYKSDFVEFYRLCKLLEREGYPTEWFSARLFDINPANGYWIKGTREDDGSVIHLQAMRIDRIQGSLFSHWQQEYRRIISDQFEIPYTLTNACPAAHELTGNLVYHGEMWVSSEAPARGIAGLLSRLAQGLALQIWPQIDHIFGIVPSKYIHQGLSIAEGYMRHEPAANHWERDRCPPHYNADDWFVTNTRRQAEYLVERPLGLRPDLRETESDNLQPVYRLPERQAAKA